MTIRVTVEDLEAGTTEVKEISNDFLLVMAGDYYLHHTQWFKNGTQILTVKREKANTEGAPA